eukprot:scaffold95197_cov19-Tisochrysis_lutea.AAC.1
MKDRAMMDSQTLSGIQSLGFLRTLLMSSAPPPFRNTSTSMGCAASRALLENERALRLSSIQRHQERAMKSLEWCRGIMPAVERGACMPPPFRDTSMLVQQWQHRLGMGTEKWTCEWTRRQGRLVVGA